MLACCSGAMLQSPSHNGRAPGLWAAFQEQQSLQLCDFYVGQADIHACRQFFRSGKSLPVDRGAGVNQAVVRTAADRVLRGDWLHLFPEGKVRS